MEWVNMVGFLLALSATLVGFGSFVATCGSYEIDSANELLDYDEEDIQIAA